MSHTLTIIRHLESDVHGTIPSTKPIPAGWVEVCGGFKSNAEAQAWLYSELAAWDSLDSAR